MKQPELYTRLIEAALTYADFGWHVFPLHSLIGGKWCSCGKPKCHERRGQGKHPRTEGWQEIATTDPTEIERMWHKWPDANIGIAAGKRSGIVVIDLDAEYNGLEDWNMLVRANAPLPPTPVSNTGGGGHHVILAHPGPEVRNRGHQSGLGGHSGIHVRADGGLIVAPPSVSVKGTYSWADGGSPLTVAPAPIPPWLLELLLEQRTNGKSSSLMPEVIEEGTKHYTFVSWAGRLRHFGANANEIMEFLREMNKRCAVPTGDDNLWAIASDIEGRYSPEAAEPSPSTVVALAPIKNGKTTLTILRDPGPGPDPEPDEPEQGTEGPETPTLLQGVYNAWDHPEPAPRKWVLPNWIPEGMITVLFGDGGLGKSYIALYIAMRACLGATFGGLVMDERKTLYIDAELDFDEFQRRAFKVARGMGLDKPPVGLHYYRLQDSIIKPETQLRVSAIIDTLGVGFSVLDSLSIAAFGGSPTDAQDVIRAMKGLEPWKTVLALDHVSKPGAGANQSHSTQFGSVFKRNIARSSMRLVKAVGGGLSFQHDKTNFGPMQTPLYFDMEFKDSSVGFRFTDMHDESMAGLIDHLTPIEKVWATLDAQEDGKATVTWLANELKLSESSVRNYLTALKKNGRADNESAGLWIVIRPEPAKKEWDVEF